jgi:KDO2-lipid IV(A) lauroyltransferase
MAFNLQRVNDSPFVISLASTLGRLLPLRTGHSLADYLAGQVANRQDSQMTRAVRANQWIARGESLEKEALDQIVYETLCQSARSIFDLYHYIQNREATRRLVFLDLATQQLIQRPEFDKRGLVVAGLHLSNFDLVLDWVCRQGWRPLVLTIPDPQGGRRTEYERRKKIGINLLPASVGAIRQALQHLQQGGVVLTGIDRPIPEPKARPRFFGRPAALPMHHVFLATKAQVPVMVLVTNLQSDGKYHVLTSELIEMDPHPDREVEMLQNAGKVLSVAEKYIRQAPQQWSISLPVWPETLSLVP